MLEASGGAVSIAGTIYAIINICCQDKSAGNREIPWLE
jgi:hypothetical protein